MAKKPSHAGESSEVEETAVDTSYEAPVAGELVGAASGPVSGSSQSYEALTVADLMAFPPKAARPSWMVTRYPVSMEEYERLNLAARTPEHMPLEPLEANSVQEDDGTETTGVQLEGIEAQEGESLPEISAAAEPAPGAPAIANSFEGIPATAWRPPDTTTAVGPNDVLVAVNTDLAGYSKAGALRFRWNNMTTLFQNVLPSGATIFDPRLAYDHYSHRWICVVAARRNSPRGSWILLGVSQGTNPAGSWWIWALDATLNGSTPTSNWADYPMLGFDTQGIYIACNMFQFGGGFQYCKLRILKKTEVYAGGTIRWYDYWNLKNPDGSSAFSVQPAAHFRGTGGNPSAYLVNSLFPSGDSLTLWTLSNPVGFWSGGSATLSKTRVPCLSYDLPPDGIQKGTTTRIETNDTRLLNAVYQYVGNTTRLWTSHTTKINWSGDSEARSAVQWYEIDVGSKTITQQRRYGAKGYYYFFPAIQTDLSRNAYVVFGRSSSNIYAEERFTSRRVSAPLGDLEGSRLIKAGESSYTGGRWGDYFGICRDGGDSSKVWMYAEYAESGNQWGTWVAASKY
jgi:hypothetical protein